MSALGAGIMTPDTLIAAFGLPGLLTAVFAETGLLFGFFLPGDSLLFTAGVLTAQMHPAVSAVAAAAHRPRRRPTDRDDERSVTPRGSVNRTIERNP